MGEITDIDQMPDPATKFVRSIDVKPRSSNEAVKPAELIQMTGHQQLSLEARRSFTLLYRAANISGIEPGKDYTVELDLVKPESHKGYERVEKSILELMQTVVTVKMPNGQTRRVQLIGGNDMDDPNRRRGTLTYSFDKRLIAILETSQVWGRLDIPVLLGFNSKYSVSFYENIAQLTGLKYKSSYTYDLEEFRQLLGVQEGKYPRYGELNKHIIKPCVEEINALADFYISVVPVKESRAVTKLKISWYPKDVEGLRAAQAELDRGKLGRRARIRGEVEYVSEPQPSMEGPQHLKRLQRLQ